MPIQYAITSTAQLKCPVCQSALEVRLAHGRSSGKTFIMAVCPKDGRHMRAFITDKNYVATVVSRLGKNAPTELDGNTR